MLTIKSFDICKNTFACLFSVHNKLSLPRHEKLCIMNLVLSERYFSDQREMTWNKTKEPVKLTERKLGNEVLPQELQLKTRSKAE